MLNDFINDEKIHILIFFLPKSVKNKFAMSTAIPRNYVYFWEKSSHVFNIGPL